MITESPGLFYVPGAGSFTPDFTGVNMSQPFGNEYLKHPDPVFTFKKVSVAIDRHNHDPLSWVYQLPIITTISLVIR
ncbi:hypothetical protein MS6015_46660 [Klebsiella pneumoniae]|nr:hypothetical protein MS6015_46660 [Klebsiella pneumoniae]